MLRIRTVVRIEGTLEGSGLHTEGSESCRMEARCSTHFETAKPMTLRFCAVLIEGGTERLEMTML
jgi:hypothetical protein